MEATQMSIHRWMDKEDGIHVFSGILLSYKKEWSNAICSNIDGPRDYHTLSKVTQRKTDIMRLNNFIWNRKNLYKWTYLQNRLIDIENKLMATKGEMEGRDKLEACD